MKNYKYLKILFILSIIGFSLGINWLIWYWAMAGSFLLWFLAWGIYDTSDIIYELMPIIIGMLCFLIYSIWYLIIRKKDNIKISKILLPILFVLGVTLFITPMVLDTIKNSSNNENEYENKELQAWDGEKCAKYYYASTYYPQITADYLIDYFSKYDRVSIDLSTPNNELKSLDLMLRVGYNDTKKTVRPGDELYEFIYNNLKTVVLDNSLIVYPKSNEALFTSELERAGLEMV